MTQIEGLEGIGQQVAEIDLPAENAGSPEPALAAVPEPEVDVEVESVTITGPDGEAHDVTGLFKAAANGELFDSGSYVDVPVVDGQATDALVIAFGGSIRYEASDKAGQDLFNALRLGKSVTLRVEGTVVDKKGGYKVSASDVETVTGTARIKIESLYLPSAEQL